MKSQAGDFKKYFDSDTFLAMLITAVFIVAFATTFTMEGVSTYLLPRILSGAGSLICLAILASKFRQFKKGAVMKGGAAEKPAGGIHVIYTIFLTVAYFWLTRYLGFILSTTLAIWLFAFLMHLRRKLLVIAVGLLLPIVLHLGFVTLLKINLPGGIIESILPF